jgi:hypothetical protein
MCVCVGIEGELLSGDSWLASMLSVVIGPSLVHTAVDTGGADWTGFAGVLRGVASVGGVLLVPSHREGVGVACDQMNMVV